MRISDLSSDVCSSDLAGRVAVCLGIGASRFLKRIGIKVPLWPMKGYSFIAPPGAAAPRVSITDTARKIVFCRLDRSEASSVGKEYVSHCRSRWTAYH